MRRKPWGFKPRLPYLPSAEIGLSCQSGLVSVVLPVYNGRPYLGEAIDSILAQTYPRWELLIIDDGSTDGSGDLAEEYAEKDPRIKVIHQENQKLPAALNRGFALAKGEFFTWISADNRMLPHGLAQMVAALSERGDMVFGNQYLIDEKGERICGHGWFEFPPGSGAVCFPPATPLLNRVANNTIGAAFLYRASADAVLGGYSPHLFLLEDYDYFMRMNSLFRIFHLKEEDPVYEYRFHPDSLTSHDKELGITAARPRLMAFDRLRRKAYTRPLPVLMTGFSAAMTKELLHSGHLISSRRPRLALVWEDTSYHGELPFCRIFPRDGGFAVAIDQGKEVFLKDLPSLAAFLRLRGTCHLLREKEKEIFLK